MSPLSWSTEGIIPKATIRWQDNDVVASSLNALWNFQVSSQPCFVSISFLSPSLCTPPHCLDISYFLSHECACSAWREQSVLWESLCLVHRDVIFTALSLLEYPDGLPSSSRIVSLSVSLSVSVSVCHSAHMTRKASPPMYTEISLGIVDGNFQSHSSCCEVT